MLTVEIRINGSIIAAITATNRGWLEGGRCKYEYQGVAFPVDNEGPVRATHGFIEHTRSEGAELLAALLCEATAKTMRPMRARKARTKTSGEES